MRTIRHTTKERLIAFERRIADLWEAGKLPFLLHLCGGNEDQLLEIFDDVSPGDWIFSGHRSHYHYLCAGGSEEKLEAMICRGDSMFVFDRQLNFLTSSVLGATACMAAGVAFNLKRQGSEAKVWCFLGDGAAEQGHFYEAVNFVAAHQLRCRFIIEDNDRSVDTNKSDRGHHRMFFPWCVESYAYRPTYPHAGSGCKHHIAFDPDIVKAILETA